MYAPKKKSFSVNLISVVDQFDPKKDSKVYFVIWKILFDPKKCHFGNNRSYINTDSDFFDCSKNVLYMTP